MGLVPKKTKADTKVLKGLTASRFLGLLMTIIMSFMIGSLIIPGWWKFLFVIFCIVVFFILTGKAPTNPNISFCKGLLNYLAFKFDTKKYVGTSNAEYKEYIQSRNGRKDRKDEKEAKEVKH